MKLSRVEVQLVEELVTAADRWKALVGVEAAAVVVEAVQERTDVLVRALTHEQSRSVAEAVMAVLWGSADPPSLWWRSPLGRALGAALPDAPITHQTAADILGVKRGTVSVLVRRGDLGVVVQPRRHGPGRPTQMHQVSRQAVLERVAQREHQGSED